MMPRCSDWVDSELACAPRFIGRVAERSAYATADGASTIATVLMVDRKATSLANAPVVFAHKRCGWRNNQSGGTFPSPVVAITVPRITVLLLRVPLVDALSCGPLLAVGVGRARSKPISQGSCQRFSNSRNRTPKRLGSGVDQSHIADLS